MPEKYIHLLTLLRERTVTSDIHQLIDQLRDAIETKVDNELESSAQVCLALQHYPAYASNGDTADALMQAAAMIRDRKIWEDRS